MTKLICPECQRENEGERIFCHSCGARLDRSSLAVAKKEQEKPEQLHRRVYDMFNPRPMTGRRTLFKLAKVILAAGVAAFIIEIISPIDVPKPSQSIGLPSEINFEMENATLYHKPPQLRYTQDQVNAYVSYALKSKQKALDESMLTFKRAVVGFREGACTITIERSFFALPLYQSATYRVGLADKKITASNEAGAIGRLPIHPKAMNYLNVIFADLWSAMDRERKLVAKMSSIEFHDGYVVLTSPEQ